MHLERHALPNFTDAVLVRMVFTFLRPKGTKPARRPHPSVRGS